MKGGSGSSGSSGDELWSIRGGSSTEISRGGDSGGGVGGRVAGDAQWNGVRGRGGGGGKRG